jgi:hypothetical protein
MSFQAMAWAVKQSLPFKEKFVLIILANYTGEDGKAWPSMSRLMEDTGLKKDSIIRATKSLEDLGIIKIDRRVFDGVNLPNVYQLHVDGVVAHSDHQSLSSTGVVANSGGGSRSQRLYTIKEPIKESIYSASDDFDTFWEHYPRKIGKLAAKSAFAKAMKITDLDTIMDACVDFASSRKGQDEAFTPHPATWLNQGRWDDTTSIKRGPPSQEEMNRRAEEFVARKKLEEKLNGKYL